MIIAYLGYVFIFDNQYRIIALIQIIYLLSAIVDINWFFFGLEEFKITVTRNTIIKFLTIALIFIFVKSTNDLWKYVVILSSTTLLSQLVLWFVLKGRISFCKISFKDIKTHIKPILVLFIPVIAVTLYKIMDKTMLGIMTNVNEVGYYEYGEKTINIPLALITALGTVMLPRISNLLSKGNEEEVKAYIKKSIKFVMFMSLAMMTGLLAIGQRFAILFLGDGFTKTGQLVMILAVTLPVISFANVIRTQYLIPYEKDRIYVVSVILGAISNLIANLILIPKLGSIGASIGTVVAETVVMLYQAILISKELPIGQYIKSFLGFAIKSVIMFICIYFIGFINLPDIAILLIQVALGVVIYLGFNLKYIFELLHINSIKDIKKIIL